MLSSGLLLCSQRYSGSSQGTEGNCLDCVWQGSIRTEALQSSVQEHVTWIYLRKAQPNLSARWCVFMALCLVAGWITCVIVVLVCVCFVGSDVNSMDSVDSGCALGKTETHQNSKPGGESSKSDLTIWEIEVPKVTSHQPIVLLALPYIAIFWFLRSGSGSVPSQGDRQINKDLSI